MTKHVVTETVGTVTFEDGRYRNEAVTGTWPLAADYKALKTPRGDYTGFVKVQTPEGAARRVLVRGAGVGYTVAGEGAPAETAAEPEDRESVDASRRMTMQEAAEEMGITRDALRKRVARGTVATETVDGVRYVVR